MKTARRRILWCLMQRYGTLAKLPKEKQKFHILKHSIATHLLDAGADLSFVKDWLGHANIQNSYFVQWASCIKDEIWC
jgi:site-specific recombinase XerD